MFAQPTTDGAEPQVDLNDVFSLRRPKDLKAGLASGFKSIAKGIFGGAAGLIAAPAIGAHQEGIAGFAKGVASGVVGAVVLPVTGVGIGLTQVVRGAAAQPEAWKQASSGKLWDQEHRAWVDKPDGSIVLKASTSGRLSRPTRGDEYYQLLQVPHDASQEVIRKQYYILARKWHPDKNPNDPTAHERFQKLGEAYQVLSNEDLRRRYDEQGVEGLDVNFMDHAAFFAMLFGSDQFEHIVGELFIAAAARAGGNLSQASLQEAQVQRVEQLAANLRTSLKRFVMGDEPGFEYAMREEAKTLVRASFGDTLLLTVGKVYEAQADIALGGVLSGTLARFRQQGDVVRSQIQAASAALKVYSAQQRLEAITKDKVAHAVKAHALQRQQGPPPSGPAEAVSQESIASPTDAQQTPQTATSAPAVPPDSCFWPESAVVQGLSKGAAEPAQPSGTGPATFPVPASQAPGSGLEGQPVPAPGDSSQVHSAVTPPAQDPAPVLSAKAQAALQEQQRKLQDAQAALEAERQKLEEATVPLVLEAMWAANALDIQNTLRRVCARVLKEDPEPPHVLSARARALKRLGALYQEVSSSSANPLLPHGTGSSTDEAQRARQRIEDAMRKVVEKREQQDQ